MWQNSLILSSFILSYDVYSIYKFPLYPFFLSQENFCFLSYKNCTLFILSVFISFICIMRTNTLGKITPGQCYHLYDCKALAYCLTGFCFTAGFLHALTLTCADVHLHSHAQRLLMANVFILRSPNTACTTEQHNI